MRQTKTCAQFVLSDTEGFFEYIEIFYKRKRKHSALGYLSPTQYLSQWAEKAVAGELAA